MRYPHLTDLSRGSCTVDVPASVLGALKWVRLRMRMAFHWTAIALQTGTRADFQRDASLQRHTVQSREQIWVQDIDLAEAPQDVGCYHPLCGNGHWTSGTMAISAVRS